MRKSPVVVFAVLAAVATACSGGSSTETTPAASGSGTPTSAQSGDTGTPATATAPQTRCGTDYLAKFTQREKLAQLLTVGITGAADATNVVSGEQVGGIFIGSWTDPGLMNKAQLDTVQAVAKVPLMVTIDEEGGRVSRAKNVIGPAPSARVVAQTQTPQQYFENSVTRSQALKDLGITVDFAPDVDVSSQPDDSVIGDRSYSDDPQVVTEYAGAYIRAANQVGLGSVIKHFPGHGSGSGDSHTGAVRTPPLDQLQNHDLVPFRNLVTSGAAVMVGHLDVPGLTEPDVPASISPAAMTLLREGTGYGAPPFDGPIFTDDLGGMAAITARMSIADAVEAALVAGADNALWISTDAVPQVLDRLEQSVASGKLPADRVDASVLRMARYKGVPLGC
ncbi:glycoside hydrolase family 3 N-terminal domain-containing protein [Nocardia asteroides]|uniref:beta-N-acetylhexosaminidase n=1 Tax=Nocardia asteroides NBRC 15531 TaxID=1110697 RepID=U5EG90_NOCAS|nr:glycoside hydrolase family 3 N-terminal domain-containing protein [Nocardia asteroides]TLF69265.1 glycoside hydrolase family 3 protein [Nocardia asteroides NBRC 15531]UGT48755.1 glycoside hydrolase family 3 protein [Nocardia asteroides]SFL69949.1 beta-N-acetylhexosaminidase [Nocardia asteroides]VEG31547.1 Beta-hexosaminidase A precursor [Nocardia asteroides]GAD85416.1 putative glycosidase [Nocardia asteroides NBRC 15531]